MQSDFELLAAWQKGDAAAGNQLFERHFASLHRFFRNKIDSGIDDLVQQTFLACVQGRERFRGDASFRTYLFAIARNLLYSEWRSRAASAKVDFGVSSVHDLRPSPSQIVADRHEQRLLCEALRHIPLDFQVALELYYWEDLRGPELAAALDIPEATVRSRLRRGVEKLRTKMAELGGAPDLLAASEQDLESWARAVRDTL